MTHPIDRRSFVALGSGALATMAAGPARSANQAEDGLSARLLARCAAERKAIGVPGFTIALVGPAGARATLVDGVADVARGQAVRPDRLFQIGSVTKSMAALALFRLAEQGKVKLDAPLASYLDGLPMPGGTPILLSHVLNHSSGMPGAAPAFPRSEGGLWRGFEPGSRFAYSNGAYALLNLVIERAAGEPFDRALRRLIFDPLGMTGATARIQATERDRYAQGYAPATPDRPHARRAPLVEAPWVDFTGAAGSVAATAADMAAYVAWLIRAARGQGDPLLGRELTARFLAPTIATPTYGADTRYASGLFVDMAGDRLAKVHHTGGMLGFSSSLLVDPASASGAFVSANVAAGGYRPRAIADYAVALLAARAGGVGFPDPQAIADPTTIATAPEFAGTYRGGDGRELVLRARDGKLLLEIAGKAVALEATTGGDLFVVPHPRFADYPLGFVREGDRIAYAFHGRNLYASGGTALPRSDRDWSALEGRYLCENPWRGTVRVVARADGLWLNGHVPLVAIGDGLFREGAAVWSPERARFDGIVNGRPQRLSRSGTDYFRVPGDV